MLLVWSIRPSHWEVRRIKRDVLEKPDGEKVQTLHVAVPSGCQTGEHGILELSDVKYKYSVEP